jgi:hypothetical protein
LCVFTQNFDRCKLVLGLGSPRGSWAAGLAPGAVALAALHSTAGLAAGLGRTQRRTKHLLAADKCALVQGRAPAGQLGTCRYRPGPGPGRTTPGQPGPPRWHRNSRAAHTEVGAFVPSEAAKTPIKAEIHREPASGYLQQQPQQHYEEHEDGDTTQGNRRTPVCLLDISYL